MSRPTSLIIEPSALLHNVKQIKYYAPGKQIIAMLKANAYGCGVQQIAPHLEGQVQAFGVACIEEALVIHSLGVRTPCILFEGVFSPEEYKIAVEHDFACVIHQERQLRWLLNTPLDRPIKIWIKVNTGMHRLGFDLSQLQEIKAYLLACPWVLQDIGLMTHLACADKPEREENAQQIALFQQIDKSEFSQCSMANSAAIIALPQTHYDAVRPGIMLYGVSPIAGAVSLDLGLMPVVRFMTGITAIRQYPSGSPIGYGGIWKCSKPSVIGLVAAGYGDGYPRHISANTPVWIRGREVKIVGRVSMDMLTVDLTDHPDIQEGDAVELWGKHVLVERIADSAGTIGYELLCQMAQRVRS